MSQVNIFVIPFFYCAFIIHIYSTENTQVIIMQFKPIFDVILVLLLSCQGIYLTTNKPPGYLCGVNVVSLLDDHRVAEVIKAAFPSHLHGFFVAVVQHSCYTEDCHWLPQSQRVQLGVQSFLWELTPSANYASCSPGLQRCLSPRHHG